MSIMKKTYQSPMTIVVAVAVTHHLLAGSGESVPVHTNSSDPTIDTQEDILSRRSHSVWDDDEEDEED